ncbi:SDR family NAD(P)-dependent oxidoreductase [Mycolicibacterium komossense]|uniref:SDR family NAD(P)-dependent oxidoreductase n=1 Tax=Mycolicibacterium komossense TaxID=1779 RepID=UPI003F4990FD
MVRRGDGVIVNIAGSMGLTGRCSATKAANHSLTKSWVAEYGPHGVRVNAVAPGPSLPSAIRRPLGAGARRRPFTVNEHA